MRRPPIAWSPETTLLVLAIVSVAARALGVL